MASALLLLSLFAQAAAAGPTAAPSQPTLPARVDRIVLHTLGGPFYGQPEMRWVFFSPAETLRRWRRPTFGAHWIVAADGAIWPRHADPGAAPSFRAPSGSAGRAFDGFLDDATVARLAREAAPVYSHVAGSNSRTVGIELAHSGRHDDTFPEEQVKALAWLVSSLLRMSGGRLGPRDVVGHKDLDRKPAYVGDRCRGPACPAYADPDGRPFRRRVDPPEELFQALAREGLSVPRAWGEGNLELARAEAIPKGEVPRTTPATRTGER
jgi:hypothetical protein